MNQPATPDPSFPNLNFLRTLGTNIEPAISPLGNKISVPSAFPSERGLARRAGSAAERSQGGGNRVFVLFCPSYRPRFVDRKQPLFLHHELPSNQDRVDIGGLEGIGELGVNVIHRNGIGPVETNQDQI